MLLSFDPGDKFEPNRYAEAYLNVVNADPREGYSRGYQAFLKSVNNGYDFLVQIDRTKVSNGSLMGVAPMGFLSNIREVKLAAMMQAITTHHQDTITHAQIVALAAHYFLHVDSKRDGLIDWLLCQDLFDNNAEANKWADSAADYVLGGKTGIKATSISAYMAYAVTSFNSLGEIMKDAVARGGDTDSAAAVSVAVASCCPEIINDIPHNLTASMDAANPGFGVEYLNTIEAKLRHVYKIA